MRITSAHTLFRAFEADRCVWAYTGEFTDGHTADLIPLAESIADRTGAAKDVRNRFAYIVVEAFQNVIRHGRPVVAGSSSKRCMVLRSAADEHWASTCNTASEEDRDKLAAALNQLQHQSQDELKALFLERLQANKVSERGGAGLGLIEMARRSRNPLVHTAIKAPNGALQLCLHVATGAKGSTPKGTVESMETAMRLVCTEEVCMLYKGPLEPGVAQILVRMIERGVDLRTEQHGIRTRAWLAAMELISSAQGTAADDCILILGRSSTADVLSLGMCLPTEVAERTVRTAAELNAMEPAAQARRYREGLLAQAKGQPSPDLGLLDLVRSGGGQVLCLHEAQGAGAFVTLSIRL